MQDYGLDHIGALCQPHVTWFILVSGTRFVGLLLSLYQIHPSGMSEKWKPRICTQHLFFFVVVIVCVTFLNRT